MSQHKKQAKATRTTFVNRIDKQLFTVNGVDEVQFMDGRTVKLDPFTITDPSELKRLLKAIYRDGATGTSRSLSKDVQAITDLVEGKE